MLSRDAIASRSMKEPYRDRKVHVRILITPEKIECSIRDEGEGFDITQLPDASNPESFRDGIGRGLVLMQAFSDELNFSDAGRHVEMSKLRLGAAKPMPK